MIEKNLRNKICLCLHTRSLLHFFGLFFWCLLRIINQIWKLYFFLIKLIHNTCFLFDTNVSWSWLQLNISPTIHVTLSHNHSQAGLTLLWLSSHCCTLSRDHSWDWSRHDHHVTHCDTLCSGRYKVKCVIQAGFTTPHYHRPLMKYVWSMILVNDVFTYTESIIIEVDLYINDWFTIFNYDVMSMGKCVTSYRVNLFMNTL